MIDLTPLEVRKKKGDFKRALRGYDASLVDDFLDLVADRLEQLVREKMGMEERLRTLEQRLGEFTAREKGLTDALVSAQEMREETRRQLDREAELTRREAEAAAENIRQEAHRAREREEDTLRRLRARQRQLVSSYRTFLEREISELEVIGETLELQGREAGLLQAPDEADERAQEQADGEVPDDDAEPPGEGEATEETAAPTELAGEAEETAGTGATSPDTFRYVRGPELPAEDGDAGAPPPPETFP